MASISSSFHCVSSARSLSSNPTSSPSSFAPLTSLRFQKLRPISAVCATAAPVAVRSSTASFYELLGVQNGASYKEIKAAYRSLARVLHPDVVPSNGQNDLASASDFIRVHEAYATLSDPGKRADYDRALFIRCRLSDVSNSSFFSGAVSTGRTRASSVSRFARRSWETDQCW